MALLEQTRVCPKRAKTLILALLEHHHCSRRAILEKYMSNKVHICFIYTSHIFNIYLTNICVNTLFCFGPSGTHVFQECLNHNGNTNIKSARCAQTYFPQ